MRPKHTQIVPAPTPSRQSCGLAVFITSGGSEEMSKKKKLSKKQVLIASQTLANSTHNHDHLSGDDLKVAMEKIAKALVSGMRVISKAG
jgi:hypothetical protein